MIIKKDAFIKENGCYMGRLFLGSCNDLKEQNQFLNFKFHEV